MSLTQPGRVMAILGAIGFGIIVHGDATGNTALAEDIDADTYEPGRVRATVVRDEVVDYLEPIKLTDGTWFTPYVRDVTVVVNQDDLDRETLRTANVPTHGWEAGATANIERPLVPLASTNCSFQVIQRLPDVGIGRASQSPICTEKDPVSTHLWGSSGQVFSGLSAAGWGSDYCGPYTQPTQYLWIDDAVSLGFYQNYSGWAEGSCTGTRNHVRLWDVLTSVGGGTAFSVGTAHRETWSWGDLTHHVVSNGWHLGRDALYGDHPVPGAYYYWGNYGYWGSGGWFGGSVAELGCYSPYGC